ncbi:collagen alpha-1(III) chain-like [Vidua macroura]|uniref:collagen alpha-1(III) chain-like n=1 Tax=Vidua macroura TaxID=187451 RepID=UPI0023A8AE44|nr:collagen alpha-1(III) chain-like [Vidua macroura]
MIHYAGVTAYNEVQSDTPVAVDNGGSGGTGLTTFLERRVVVAIREVTRRDLHEGGPASREGTDRIFRGRRSPCGPSARPGGSPEPPAHPQGEERLPLQAAPRMCTHPPIWDAGRERSTAPHVPPAAPRWKSMNVCSVRSDPLASGALLLVGKGGEKKGSLRTPAHVLASGGAAPRCRRGGNGGRAGCQRRREEPSEQPLGTAVLQVGHAKEQGTMPLHARGRSDARALPAGATVRDTPAPCLSGVRNFLAASDGWLRRCNASFGPEIPPPPAQRLVRRDALAAPSTEKRTGRAGVAGLDSAPTSEVRETEPASALKRRRRVIAPSQRCFRAASMRSPPAAPAPPGVSPVAGQRPPARVRERARTSGSETRTRPGLRGYSPFPLPSLPEQAGSAHARRLPRSALPLPTHIVSQALAASDFHTRGAARRPRLLSGLVTTRTRPTLPPLHTPAHTHGAPAAYGRWERSQRRARAAACVRLRETRGPSLRPLWQRSAATAGPAARPRLMLRPGPRAGGPGGGSAVRSAAAMCVLPEPAGERPTAPEARAEVAADVLAGPRAIWPPQPGGRPGLFIMGGRTQSLPPSLSALDILSRPYKQYSTCILFLGGTGKPAAARNRLPCSARQRDPVSLAAGGERRSRGKRALSAPARRTAAAPGPCQASPEGLGHRPAPARGRGPPACSRCFANRTIAARGGRRGAGSRRCLPVPSRGHSGARRPRALRSPAKAEMKASSANAPGLCLAPVSPFLPRSLSPVGAARGVGGSRGAELSLGPPVDPYPRADSEPSRASLALCWKPPRGARPWRRRGPPHPPKSDRGDAGNVASELSGEQRGRHSLSGARRDGDPRVNAGIVPGGRAQPAGDEGRGQTPRKGTPVAERRFAQLFRQLFLLLLRLLGNHFSPSQACPAARGSKHNKTSPALAPGESPGADPSLRSETPRAGLDAASAIPFARHSPAPPSRGDNGGESLSPGSRGPPAGLRTARSRERAEPCGAPGAGTAVRRDGSSRSPPGPESGGRGKSCGGHPSPSSAVSRGQPSAAVYFVIKSIKLPLSYKTGAEREGGGGLE